MEAGDLLREGGFAFAALLFGTLLVWSLRLFRDFMRIREGFITRLLDRLDKTEDEHIAMIAAIKTHSESSGHIANSLKEIEISLARLNGSTRR